MLAKKAIKLTAWHFFQQAGVIYFKCLQAEFVTNLNRWKRVEIYLLCCDGIVKWIPIILGPGKLSLFNSMKKQNSIARLPYTAKVMNNA